MNEYIEKIISQIDDCTVQLKGLSLTSDEYEKVSKSVNDLFIECKIRTFTKKLNIDYNEMISPNYVTYSNEFNSNKLSDLIIYRNNSVVTPPKEKVCECGKEKYNFARHLEYCDLYE
jgi:hypothetical protein